MNIADKDTALSFYCYLCSVIGSVEVVRARRQLYDAFDKIRYSKLFVTVTSGSKGEGLDLTGSDLDLMFVYFTSNRYIYETSDKAQHSSKKRYLLMKMSDTKPGFTKLSLKNANDRQINDTLYVQDGDELYLSNKEFKEWMLNFVNSIINHDYIIHGPCMSTASKGTDYAFCLHCPEWITPAQPWIKRLRVSWPSSNLISSIIKNGVLLVPIGCKHSNSENLEWRISFSVAEKQLIYTFQHTQLLCYALLKILLKEIINKNEDLKDLLCSYFLKTVMFWVSEETPLSAWKPDNILSCFMSCFQRLIYCVEIFTCPHYFIPENNLFENKIVGLNQIRLLSYLKLLYNTGWQCLFQSNTISQIDFTEFLGHGFTSYCTDKILNMCALNNVLRYGKFIFGWIILAKRSELGLINLINYRPEKKNLYIFLCSFCSQAFAQTIIMEILNNKYQYKQYRYCLCHLLIGIHSIPMSGWLLLASLFYKTKQYNKTLIMLSHALTVCTVDKLRLDKYAFDRGRNQFKWLSKNTLYVQDENLTTKLMKSELKNVFCLFGPTLIPQELYTFCRRTFFVTPPTVYAYFLRFLCFYNLHDTRNLYDSLKDLQLTIRKRFFVDRGSHLTLTERYLNEYENNDASYALGTALHMVGDWQSFSHYDNRIDKKLSICQFGHIVLHYFENIVRERFSSFL